MRAFPLPGQSSGRRWEGPEKGSVLDGRSGCRTRRGRAQLGPGEARTTSSPRRASPDFSFLSHLGSAAAPVDNFPAFYHGTTFLGRVRDLRNTPRAPPPATGHAEPTFPNRSALLVARRAPSQQQPRAQLGAVVDQVPELQAATEAAAGGGAVARGSRGGRARRRGGAGGGTGAGLIGRGERGGGRQAQGG